MIFTRNNPERDHYQPIFWPINEAKNPLAYNIHSYIYLPWLCLAILLLTPIGFERYFTRLFNSEITSFIINFHAIRMSIWCLLLLLQPLLIINKKNHLHQTLGKLTIWFMPILLFIMYLTVKRPLANVFLQK